jgi:PAS domain S-box-containing protein
MDNFFGGQLTQEELLRRRHSRQRNQRQQQQQQQLLHSISSEPPQQASHYNVPVPGVNPTNPDTTMVGADSLDDIVRNTSADPRRRSLPQHQFSSHIPQSDADRRMSMLEFGNTDTTYRDYRYGIVPDSPADPMNAGFHSMGTDMPMSENAATFTPQTMLSDEFATLSPDMMGNMIAMSNMNMGQIAGDPSISMFPSPSLPNTFHQVDGLPSGFNMGLQDESDTLECPPNGNRPLGPGGDDGEFMHLAPQFPTSGQAPPQVTNMAMDGMNGYVPSHGPPKTLAPTSAPTYQHIPASTGRSAGDQIVPQMPQQQIIPAPTMVGPQPPPDKMIYSQSGFDMLRALFLVATRKDPQVHLGAVDMSCAFVVCDVTMNDCPIIYVSDNFQNLTGYHRAEIVGKNCRFLQAPDGNVEAGSKREFVDNGAVYNLKLKIAECKEVQQSLINYRKGGKPFLNLLTMIPIPWGDDREEIKYIIGFQIDLVECPDAIAASHGPGAVKVNYKQSELGQYIWTPPASSQWEPENGQTLGVDDVSTLLQQYNPKGAGSDWHKQSWDKMLLENADDVVHVLSLKGLFLYLSPSCKRVLEYDAAELVGNSISSICHPSDIVPLTRELKDTTSGNTVNIVFRIRRKHGGYTWFESHGSLFLEQGKGRKCIILIGRRRPVFSLSRRQLESKGGIGDGELWTKLSTSGMFLFVSANVRSLLDLQPEKLVGTSIQELMRKESRPEFGRSIEKARKGQTVTCKHEVQNRRGQVLQAQTVLYPGDTSDRQKPTFLLAQTKLLKASSRAAAASTTSASLTSRPGPTANQTLSDARAMVNYNVIQPGQLGDEQYTGTVTTYSGGVVGSMNQDQADDNIFDELKTTRCTSWQYELRQMEKVNRVLAEELHGLLSNKKKRKRRKGVGNVVRDCANCHTRNTPEWRRGPSGQRDLCNSCGLRWAKQVGVYFSRIFIPVMRWPVLTVMLSVDRQSFPAELVARGW